MVLLNDRLKAIEGGTIVSPQMRIQASIEILGHVVNSAHVNSGCVMISADTVANMFREIYQAVGEALSEHELTASQTDVHPVSKSRAAINELGHIRSGLTRNGTGSVQ